MELGIAAGVALAAASIAYARTAFARQQQHDPAPQPPGLHFGVPLEDCPTNPETGVPLVLELIVPVILQHAGTEGVFRVPGDTARAQQLREALEAADITSVGGGRALLWPAAAAVDPGDPASVHIASTVLKLWLRERPQADRLLEPITLDEGGRRSDNATVSQVVASLSPVRQAVIRTILQLCNVVIAHHEQNRMNRLAVAICLAPAMFSDPDLKDPGACMRVCVCRQESPPSCRSRACFRTCISDECNAVC